MNGPHDLGGRMGFGPVRPELDEPVFHAEWEKRALALVLAMGAARQWNIDMSRQARERLPPAFYLSASYYEIWIAALERLLAETGLLAGAPQVVPRLAAEQVPAVLARGGPCSRALARAPLFKPGAPVRARNLQPRGHTRLPAYLRRAQGVVVRHHGGFVFPDSNAQGLGEDPRHLYTVRFTAAELFGGAGPDEVHADLFEPYLDAA